MVALIVSVLSQPVADLVLSYSDAQDIWEKLVSVYEQSSNQRLSMLMMEFFKAQSNPEMGIAAYVAKVEKLFSDMNTELHRRGLHDIPIELLHGQILATLGPEYQEVSNVWELLDDNKQMTNSLLEKLCMTEKRMQTSMTAAESSAFVAHASTTKSQSLVIKTTSSKPSGSKKSTKDNRENCSCFHCRRVGHLKMKCRKLKAENNKSVATDSMGSSSVDDTRV